MIDSQLSHFYHLIDIQFQADREHPQGRSDLLRFGLAVSDLFDASHKGKVGQCPFESLFEFLSQVLTALRRLAFILANGNHVKKYIRDRIRQQADEDDLSDLSGLAALDKKFKALQYVLITRDPCFFCTECIRACGILLLCGN